jgi:hypothetical protein
VRGRDLFGQRVAPDWGGAAATARRVLAEIDVPDPRLGKVETLAFLRGLEVREAPLQGARANLVRVGDKGMVTISQALSAEEKRFAIAHELGHFEMHKTESYLGLCTGEQLLADYTLGGGGGGGKHVRGGVPDAAGAVPAAYGCPRGDVGHSPPACR